VPWSKHWMWYGHPTLGNHVIQWGLQIILNPYIYMDDLIVMFIVLLPHIATHKSRTICGNSKHYDIPLLLKTD
jgi:hypothetical protein